MCSALYLVNKSLKKSLFLQFLMIYSSLASGVIALLLATQLQIHFAPPWVTALLIYAYCFVYNIGAATVPFVLAAEVFLPEVRE